MRLFLIVIVACTALFLDDSAVSAQERKPKPTLSLTLETAKESIRAGTEPVLRLTIENVGKVDEKILRPRGDLQDTYYDLVITKEGKPLKLGRAISDPGPIPDEDFLTLKPGKKITFEFSRYAVAVHDLAPGKYQAQIRFWQNPYQSHTTAIMSPAASFAVEK